MQKDFYLFPINLGAPRRCASTGICSESSRDNVDGKKFLDQEPVQPGILVLQTYDIASIASGGRNRS